MSKVHYASRVVAYLPSLKTILQRLRATSATPSSLSSTLLTTTSALPAAAAWDADVPETRHSHSSTALSNIISSPLSSITTYLSLHPSLPLPGAMGLAETTPTTQQTTSVDRDNTEYGNEEDAPVIFSSIKDKPHGTVECMAQEILEFLVSDLMLLFPGVSLHGAGLNVITLSQRTFNDMTGWSMDVEKEREQLLEHFVDSAKEICSRLNGAGFWADFIDPSSGRAFYSAYSSATLFETDDRFRFFGFNIIDLGCCKCIHHPVWGPFTFVGIIFTSAPTNSPAVQSIMEL